MIEQKHDWAKFRNVNCELNEELFPGFTQFDIETDPDQGVVIHGIHKPQDGGTPPLLLLHGFPECHFMWRKVAPTLAQHYSVVAVDLRGYGASTNGKDYSKRAMARDCVTVMDKLGYSAFYLCGHDRGGRVAHALSVDYPSKVIKVMLLDIVPGLNMYEKMSFTLGKLYYHWFFLIQQHPMPEKMIAADPMNFLSAAVGNLGNSTLESSPFESCINIYASRMASVEGVTGMCEDYRAGASVDLLHTKEDIAVGRKISPQLKVVWGTQGVVARCFPNVLDIWKTYAKNVSGETVDCGHYIPEELPEETLRLIYDFFPLIKKVQLEL
uniref:ARAD1D44572p n=1 Tax=Blastobotrys adeninivorans TaxID=409370 RepID=A0A060TD30_BLAAD